MIYFVNITLIINNKQYTKLTEYNIKSEVLFFFLYTICNCETATLPKHLDYIFHGISIGIHISSINNKNT